MRARAISWVVLGGGCMVAATASFLACADPYDGMAIPPAAEPDGSAAASSADAAPGDAAAADATDAADAADAAPDPCSDRDKDGFQALGCDGGAAGDCDDLDPATNPDAGYSSAVPLAPAGGDWNCDGMVSPLYPAPISCNTLGPGTNCATVKGFKTVVPCGASGMFVTCRPNGILSTQCTDGVIETRTQSCR